MRSESIACAFDVDNDGMVQEPIQKCSSDDWIPEYFSPFSEATIGREDHRPLFISGIDQLEETDWRRQW